MTQRDTDSLTVPQAAPVEPYRLADAPQFEEDNGLSGHLTVLRRRLRLMLAVMAVVVGLGMAYTLTRRPVYEATAKIVTMNTRPSASLPSDDLPLLSDVQALTRSRTALTQVEVISSPDLLDEAWQNLNPRARVDGFAGRDSLPNWAWYVRVVKDTDVIAISGRAYEPKAAAMLANGIAQAYFRRDTEQSNAAIRQARIYAEKKMAIAGRDLSRANSDLARFKQQTGLFAPDTQLTKAAEHMAELTMALDTSKAEASAHKQELSALMGEFRSSAPNVTASTTVEVNPQFAAIRSKIDELNSERLALLQEYTPSSREVRTIDERIKAEQERLRKVAQTVVSSKLQARNPVRDTLLTQYAASLSAYAAANARSGAIQAELENRTRDAQSLPERQRVLSEHLQRVAVLQRTYDLLSNKYYALLLNEQSAVPNGMLVSTARPSSVPVQPNARNSLVVFVLLGALLAVITAIIAERLDNRMHDQALIERDTGLEPLSYVPKVPSQISPRIINNGGDDALLESFRILRNNIALDEAASRVKVLAITSPSRGDGKTTTAVNLATAMAMDGKRVLVVDADLRRPSLADVTDAKSCTGLTSVLKGSVDVSKAIVRTKIANVWCLPSGPASANPAETLNSQASRDLFAKLAEQYDAVIVDCPPAAGLSDIQVISTLADGVLVVVSTDRTLRSHLNVTLRTLGRAKAPIIGMVVNRVDARRGYGYYCYGEYK